jgi:hypothetical protein
MVFPSMNSHFFWCCRLTAVCIRRYYYGRLAFVWIGAEETHEKQSKVA